MSGCHADPFAPLTEDDHLDARRMSRHWPEWSCDEVRATALQAYGRHLWSASRLITANDPAGVYLIGRGCALPPAAGDLRWMPSLRHPSGWSGPALIARITAIESGKPLNLMRTWVDPKRPGKKASIDRPRLSLWKHRKTGGAIRLWPDDEVATGLAVGEGVETMLSAARGFEPVWSLIDAGNLAAMPVLGGIEALTVVVDNDPAGLKAFNAIARRWRAAGCEVRRVLIQEPGADFNSWAVGDADG